jgi:predicted O-methyltransferase YrrM
MLFAHIFHHYRSIGLVNFPLSKAIFLRAGFYPIIDHYYEPLFDPKHLRHSLGEDRSLPGVDLNDTEQLDVLGRFAYNDELLAFPLDPAKDEAREFCYNVGPFGPGDAEYLYSMIRLFKPRRIVEIGSGSSTLMARNAVRRNAAESSDEYCEHICIEPYENSWLEEAGVTVIRERVEDVSLDVFRNLNENDLLFIDSSHIIRPQGDVLFEYLEVLPSLNAGVIVHIHDIFTPRDYLDAWFGENFWNEQYLLEAFLTCSSAFRIIGATNYLSHKYNELFSSKCPIYKTHEGTEPGSFYIVKN